MKSIDEFLADVRREGVQVWADGEDLRCRAPRGRLTPEIRHEITSRREEILRVLGAPAVDPGGADGSIARVHRGGELPLSSAQQRLWFLDQYDGDNLFYVIPIALRFRGPLDLDAFRHSIHQIVRRHEILRTVFPASDGRPVQRILDNPPVEIPVLDLEPTPPDERERMIAILADQEAARSFDLAVGPLFRVTLLRVAAEDHVFLLTMHHIISDAWSTGILIREFSELYTAMREGRPPSLPVLEIQFADYAAWQRECLRGEVHQHQVSYWKQQLAGVAPLLELPWDRTRPAILTHHGRIEAFALDEAITRKLKALGHESGASLYMTLLAGFSALLARYSGQDDIVIGSPIANRTRREVEPLIGFFVNTLVMRTDLSGRPSFRELLARVKGMALDAFAHQDLPFEDLVDQLHLERSLSFAPLFQVMLALQNTPIFDLELSGLTVTSMTLGHESAKFDLTLILVDHGPRLSGSMEYNTDLFDAATIRRMLGHLTTLLQAAVDDPDRPIAELPLIGADERRQLVVEWNQSARPYPQESIARIFERRAAASPRAVAVTFLDRTLTYAELDHRADQLACFLQDAGLRPEATVGVCLERSLEMVVAILGILKAGGAYVPLAADLPRDRLALMIADADPSRVLAQGRTLSALPPGRPLTLCLDSEWDRLSSFAGRKPRRVGAIDDLAYVMYTSGSSGQPKGVAVPQRGVVRLVCESNFAHLGPEVCSMAYAPLSFDASTLEIWAPLLNGGRLVLAPSGTLSLEELAGVLRHDAVNTVWLTGALFQQMVDYQIEAFADVRSLLAGGDVLSPAHVERMLQRYPDCTVINGYGPTENTTLTCCHRMTGPTRFDGSVPIGRPISNTTVYILDDRMEPVPIGVAGELYAGGDGLARGYINDSRLTHERFVRDPFSDDPRARLYRTGDRARYRSDGCIEFLGRIDQQVKLRGFRIELGEIEAVLGLHPEVLDSVTVIREGSRGDKRLVSYVVPASHELTTHDLRQFLRSKLPEYMVPSAFVLMESLPLTKNDKVDRRALPEPERSVHDSRASHTPPRTPIEELVAGIWSNVLRVGAVGIHDNFFELGGHSLIATQIVSRLRGTFQIELPLRELFEAPTVAGISERIEFRRNPNCPEQLPPIVPISHEQPLPLSHAQERLWFLDQLDPGTVSYNIPIAFRCRGELDIAALRCFLKELVRRHASLRTTFTEVDGRPVQRIQPHMEIDLDRRSLAQLDAASRDAEVRRLALAESLKSFSLTTGPLLRATALEFGINDYVLLFTIHHIVADGWSMGVLTREFSALYPAFVRGLPSPLPDLEIQYADFAVWQREWLQGERLQSELDYWVKQLAGAPHVLELPADRPRPPIQTFRGGAHPFALPADVTGSLKALGQESGASLFMTLFAGFATLIHRYTGEDDFLIGAPIANRNHHAIEPLIGFFVNTMALRADLSGDPEFLELLERVRHVTLDAYAHQDVPFEYLVEKLQPKRDMSRNPLVQVSLVFLNAPLAVADLEGVTLHQVDTETGTARFDLEVFLWQEAGGLRGVFAYYTDLFEAPTIHRMVRHFETLLRGIADRPDRPLSALPILEDEEKRALLVDGNATEADYPRELCVHELFEAQAARNPDEIAVVYRDRHLTYAQLDGRSNQLARFLQGQGIGPGGLVGICMGRSFDLVVAVLGILKAGAAYVPLDASYPHDRLAYMIEDARLSMLLTHTATEDRVPTPGPRRLCLDMSWDQLAREDSTRPESAVRPTDLIYVIYTSGSTGRPKGVMLEHRNVVNYLTWARGYYRVQEGTGAPVNSSISFDATVTSLWVPLAAGRTVELLPEQDELVHLAEALGSGRDFSLVKITPAHLQALAHLLAGPPAAGPARAFVIGGEALTGAHLEPWLHFAPQARFINEYGPTEATVGCCVHEVRRDTGLPAKIPIGRPIANTRLYVLDRQQRPVPAGVPGELYIGGDGVGRGYLYREELTAERFVPDPFSAEPGARMYRTGDRVRRRCDGELEFLGRLDSQVKVRGYRIELGEIERVLSKHPAVANVVLMARDDHPGDVRLVAYLLLDDTPMTTGPESHPSGSDPQLEQVAQWANVFEDSYSRPRADDGPTFDIAGWNSSYTGEPIPAEQMREWVDQTVRRIGAHRPRRIWEIGCGTGLLLSRLAPEADSYVGTDFSDAALRRVERLTRQVGGLGGVRLLRRAANDVSGIEGSFDTIVLNSVIQYFPDVDYLLSVLDGAVDRLAPGGRIFVGDVRSLPLLEMYASSVEYFGAADSLTRAELDRRIRRRQAREEELVVDPRFFVALQSRYPGLTRVQVELKRGRHNNELLRFRYDATLYFGSRAQGTADITWHDWRTEPLPSSRLCALLDEQRPDVLVLRHVPNARLRDDLRLVEGLQAATDTETVAEIRRRLDESGPLGIDPEQFAGFGEERRYSVEIAPSVDPACFDAVFRRIGPEGPSPAPVSFFEPVATPRPWRRYANNPLRMKWNQRLVPELRSLAESMLPDYMVPSAFVVLEAFPLTANGKVDVKSLPAPDGRGALATDSFVTPRTPVEEILAAIWADVLRVDRVGIYDDFFSLGGHSLLATQVISRIREAFVIELQVRTIFEAPNVAGLGQIVVIKLQDSQQDAPAPPLGPQARGGLVPLSFAQERLWFLDRLEANSAAYNMPTAHRLVGWLDVKALQKSLQEIANRHEVLRTTFAATADGEPLQRIASEFAFDLPVIDLEHLDEETQRAAIECLTADETRQRFDIERGPLWRAKLLRVRDNEHILLASMHHIISDGWSMGILIRELGAIYEAFCEDRPCPLDPLPLQYADYAIWQRERLTGAVLQGQFAYWKAHLHAAPPLLELPTDYSRPPVQSFVGRTERFELDQELSDDIIALSRRHGMTLYMTLLAAFSTLLSRYSRQDDLVIGSPIAGRNRREIEGLIGFFVNTLGLRIDLSDAPSFADLMRRVRKVALDAYAHQDVPFEHLVEELHPERNLGHAPVFQVMFVLQNAPRERVFLRELTLSPLSAEQESAKFDLTLCMGEGESNLWGWFEYRTALFERATIQRMVGHFQNLLRAVVADPSTKVGRLQLLSPSERRQVLREGRGPHVEGFTPVIHRFERQARTTPEHVAVEMGRDALTYRVLNETANRLARRLEIAPGTRVGIALERGFALVVSILAVLKAGGVYVPLDPDYPHERLSVMLDDSRAELLLTRSQLVPNFPAHAARVILLDEPVRSDGSEYIEDPGVPIRADDLAYIIYTSGSTGRPKGVAMTHRAMANLIRWQVEEATGFTPARTLQFTSISFDVSFQEIFSTWCAGGTLVLVDDTIRRDSRALVRFLGEHNIERLFLPFVALQQLAQSALERDATPLALRDIITAGEQLRITPELAAWLRRLPGCRLHNHYGPAESHVVTAWTLAPDLDPPPALPPIGRPIANSSIYILDEQGQPVPHGVPGELFIGGDCLASGYWDSPDLTEERFVANPFEESRNARMYRTGDLARFLPDGNIEFLGRVDDQVKIRGFRIEPGEIESVLATSSAVGGVAVVAREDRPGDRRLVAYIVPNPGSVPVEGDLRTLVRRTLPEYMVPSAIVFLDAFPMTPSGKVDRRKLPAPDFDARASAWYVAPRDTDELRLAEIWEATLGRRPVGVKDHFFDLGGHSLLAVRVMARVEREFGIDLPLSVLFQNPTVEQLARRLRQPVQEERLSCLVPIQPRGEHPPFFCVPGAGGNVLYLYDLARRLGGDQPFYGLQALGLDGQTRAAQRIEDAAGRYIEEIRSVQPRGPYFLGGHSFGGQVAYEIARQLQEGGEEVGLLVIFDTNAPRTIERPASLEHDDDARWLCEIATVIEHLSGRKQHVSYDELSALEPGPRLVSFRASLIKGGWLPEETTQSQLATFVEVYKANIRADYRPEGPIPTRIVLFKAGEPMVAAEPDATTTDLGSAWGWDEFADGEVPVHIASGNHLTMMTEPHVNSLAQRLRECLNRQRELSGIARRRNGIEKHTNLARA